MADIKINTPIGTAVFPALRTPDTKFDALGIYKADLRLSAEDAKPLMNNLTSIFKRHTGRAPVAADNTMWMKEVDKETGEETGNIILKMRVKNRKRKNGEIWDRRPVLFDSELVPLDANPWGDTKMRVSASVYAWDTGAKKGVSLQPVAIQILDLVEGDGLNASSFGFTAEEDGYKSTDSSENNDFDDLTETPNEDFGDF